MATGEDISLIATVITILFSTVVLGWALLYKCTDTTLISGDFTFDKCFSFFPEAEKPKTQTQTQTKVEVKDDNLFVKSTSTNGEDDKEDVDYKFVSEFNEMDTRLYGTGYSDISARTLGECAKICYEQQVPVGPSSLECGGFTSEFKDIESDDDRIYCRLYPKGNLSDSTLPSYEKRSFYLKGTTLTAI